MILVGDRVRSHFELGLGGGGSVDLIILNGIRAGTDLRKCSNGMDTPTEVRRGDIRVTPNEVGQCLAGFKECMGFMDWYGFLN